MAQFQLGRDREIRQFDRPRRAEIAADALRGGGVDRQDALAVIQAKLAVGGNDRSVRAVDVTLQILQHRGVLAPLKRHFRATGEVNERINHVAGAKRQPARHVLQPQLIERGVLGQGSAPQREQRFGCQIQGCQDVSLGNESFPINQRGGRKLPHHRRRHDGPRLHEVVRLDGPRRAVVREMDDAIGPLQRTVSGVKQRAFRSIAVRPVKGCLGNHRGLAGIFDFHRRMDEHLRLAGLLGVEPQGAAVGEGLGFLDRPRRVRTFMATAEIAVSVDEVARCVRQFFQRPEDLRARRDPVRGRHDPFESEIAQVFDRVFIKRLLTLGEEPRGVLVARRFFVEDVPPRSKADAPFARRIAVGFDSVPSAERGVD